jgi:hypothetical protein
MSIGEMGLSVLKGAAQGVLAGVTGGVSTASQALVTAVASQLPGINIPIGDNASLSISPGIMFGSSGFSVGANVGFSINTKYGSIGASYGVGYGSNKITGKTGVTQRLGYGVAVGGRDFNLQIGSSNFYGGGISQQTGYLGVGGNNWSVMYENDYMFDIGNSDGGDRFRTTGVRLRYGDFSLGLNMFTGEPATDENGNRMSKELKPGQFQYIEAGEKYRAGILYAGYGNYRVGLNGEPIRNFFQNHLVHKDGYKYPIFEVLGSRLSPYVSYQTVNPYTTW